MNFLQTSFLNNTIQQYALVLSAILFAFILRYILSKILVLVNAKFIQKKWAFVTDEDFTSLIAKPLSRFIFVAITIIAIDKLHYPTALAYTIKKIPLFEVFQKIGDALILIYFFYFVTKAINFVALILVKSTSGANDKGHDQIVIFLRDLIKIAIGIIAVLLILKIVFNQNIGNLLTGLSIVGAAIALAAKESIENLIASFIIFFDKPFFTGDTLKVNNVTGTVEHIGLRSTRIRTPERTLVTVPNKQMVDSVVDNMSMRNLRRAEIKITFSDKNTAAQIQKFMADVELVIKNKPTTIVKHSIHFTELTKDGSIILLEFFTPAFTRVEYDIVKQTINFAIMELLQKNNIEVSTSATSTSVAPIEVLPTTPKQDNLL